MEERIIRINKALREFNVSLERAVDFLKSKGIHVDANPNTKISTREYLLLNEMFGNSTKTLESKYIEDKLNIQLKESKDKLFVDRNEFVLNKNRKISKLNLSSNQIHDINFLSELVDLEELNLIENNIWDISQITSLSKLKKLNISFNYINDISNLKDLKDLEVLRLDHNKIYDISYLSQLSNLKVLSLANNSLEFVQSLSFLPNLIQLNLESNYISELDFLSDLKKILFLDLSSNKVENLSVFEKLQNIETLFLSHNLIANPSALESLKTIKTLVINNNEISEITFLKKFKELIHLNLSNNRIEDIKPIKNLKSLQILHLSFNEIKDISALEKLDNLEEINLFGNPIVDSEAWKMTIGSNYVDLVKDYFSRLKGIQQEYVLPVKILFMGNHASGKSTLLDYLSSESANRKLEKPNSTHIVRIQHYPKSINNEQLPKRIYYDFGGQDYYHGIYRAFLTNEAINILVWNSKNENNQIRIDSNNCNTRDFTKEYWLHQLKYSFTKKAKYRDEKNPVLLVQTHADIQGLKKETFKGDYSEFNIENEFFISLNEDSVSESEIFKASLNYLEAQISEDVRKNMKTINRPEWYGKFINFILSYESEKGILVEDILKHYNRVLQEGESQEDLLPFLRNDLDQLHKQGLILYYKDVLPSVAWLNPTATTKYIHNEVLKKGTIVEKGIVKKDAFKEIDRNVIELLLLQKVIFLETSKEEYIIPNFLPLVEEEDKEYSIITFGLNKPDYVLKFENFLPFGIVNQLVCHFGNNPDTKHFWRDQLIFTLEKQSKILIKLDFTNLEIAVYFQFIDNDYEIQYNIKRYIYNCLLAVYWDRQLIDFDMYMEIEKLEINREFTMKKGSIQELINMAELFNHERLISIDDNDISEFSDSKVPNDMYLSIDNKTFINGSDFLERINKNEYTINSYEINEFEELCNSENNESKILKRKLNLGTPREKPIYPYQVFTNKKINKMKKIFISYSHDDLKYRKELQSYLTNLERENKIEIWHDEFIEAGVGWNDKIIGKLEESDIVILLISQTFISSRYIHEIEMRKTLKQKNNSRCKIIPVLISGCDWINWNVFIDDKSIENNLEEIEKGKLNNYQLMPMNNDDQRLTPINKWEFPEDAWLKIIKQVRDFSI